MNRRPRTSALARFAAAIGLLAFSLSGCGTSTTGPGLIPVDCDEDPTANDCQDPDPGQRLEAPGSVPGLIDGAR